MKWVIIIVLALLGVFDYLLIVACSKLEREYEVFYEKSDCCFGVCNSLKCDSADSE